VVFFSIGEWSGIDLGCPIKKIIGEREKFAPIHRGGQGAEGDMRGSE
jgi:hypothetical protein